MHSIVLESPDRAQISKRAVQGCWELTLSCNRSHTRRPLLKDACASKSESLSVFYVGISNQPLFPTIQRGNSHFHLGFDTMSSSFPVPILGKDSSFGSLEDTRQTILWLRGAGSIFRCPLRGNAKNAHFFHGRKSCQTRVQNSRFLRAKGHVIGIASENSDGPEHTLLSSECEPPLCVYFNIFRWVWIIMVQSISRLSDSFFPILGECVICGVVLWLHGRFNSLRVSTG